VKPTEIVEGDSTFDSRSVEDVSKTFDTCYADASCLGVIESVASFYLCTSTPVESPGSGNTAYLPRCTCDSFDFSDVSEGLGTLMWTCVCAPMGYCNTKRVRNRRRLQ
jgi:hypothetical protein